MSNTRYRLNLSEKDHAIMREMMENGMGRRSGEKSKKTSNTEFECNFNAYQPNERAFTRVVTALSMSTSFRPERSIPVMDITGTSDPQLRVSVLDKPAIAKYLASGIGTVALSNIDALRKSDAVSAPYRIDDYGLSVALRTETKVDNVATAVSQLQSSSRFNARYKQRISFLGTSGNFRVDCTVVSQSSFVSGTTPHIWEAPKRYEIEVELINGVAVLEEAWTEFLQIIAFVYANLDASPYCIRADIKRQTLAHLRNLTGATGFVGPKPVSISVENVMPAREGTFSILNGYCVTEKADGEHMLLFVTPDGEAFIIDSRLNVRYTGISGLPQDLANTLLDGEYIQDWKLSSSTQAHEINGAAFLSFDVYFKGGASVAQMPFSERLDVMRAVTQAIAKSSEEAFVAIKSKQFVAAEGVDMFAASERILSQHRMYEIDGLVFAPLNFPVGANAPGDTATLRGTWPAMLKWKPPHQNTIDFLVRFATSDSAAIDASGDTVVRAQLMASYMGGDRTPLAVIASIAGPNVRGKAGGNVATAKEFASALLIRRGKDGKIVCENGETLPDACVAEFRYDVEHGWKPTRVRHDKTQQLQLTNSIGGTANDFNVARKIWQTIMDPVTVEMITGKERVRTDSEDGAYYNRAVLREQLAMLPMMRFHNWVKDRILGAAAKATEGVSILDIATGKGGDINKWLNAGFSRMVGFDVNPDNLVNEEDGAYARLGDKFVSDPASLRRRDIVFAQWDMTAPIEPGSHRALVTDTTMRGINDAVFAFVADTKVSRELAHLYGIANKPFDVVSCQFAIHYAFRSKEALDTLCRTVASRLKDGGVIVATCMDGRAVDAALSGGILEGRKNGKLVWSIKRGNIPDGDGKGFGREIEVYIESINATHTEYLVDPELLHQAMTDHGLVAPKNGEKLALPESSTPWLIPFEAFMKASVDVRDDPRATEAANMSSDEKRFSAFNCCVVFRRGDAV